MFITRGVSLTNFFVASSALAFQVFVLYPWHKQLDDDFEKLKHEHLRVLRTIERFHPTANIAAAAMAEKKFTASAPASASVSAPATAAA